ncbi:MAG: PD40 domain-containing protein [Deltaproteobacteria bacterium]|nr:PD40 domain-containing protein [Deltaproteobacteria bacterium]
MNYHRICKTSRLSLSQSLSYFLKLIIVLFSFSFSFLYLTPSWAGLTPPKLKWWSLQTEHFNIHYHEGQEENAQRMAMIAEKVHRELSPRFDWKPWGRTEVVVTDLADFSNGVATVVPYNLMVLLVSPPLGGSALSYYENWLEDLFRHEYTHILHLDRHGGIAKPFRYVFGKIISPNGLSPGWTTEGMAVQQESLTGKGRANSSYSEMLLRTDIYNNQFLKLDEMNGSQFEWPSAQARYIYGGMFWSYLADTYGQEKVFEYAKRYSESLWLFAVNHKARKTFEDKNFYQLHREWKASLTQRYEKVRQELNGQGLTELKQLKGIEGNLMHPTLSPDGQWLAYTYRDDYNNPEIRQMRVDGSEDQILANKVSADQMSFSPDGQKIVYSRISRHKRFHYYYDLFELDLKTKKSTQLTQGERAFHPDYSPDGKKIVFVANRKDSTQLFLWDVKAKKMTALTPLGPAEQFSNPRFSPDGQKIAVSRWKEGQRDIYLYDLKGNVIQQISQDDAVDLSPEFSSPDHVIFSSDRSGITNIYEYQISTKQVRPLTNVLTGVFEPQVFQGKLYVQHYFGRGYDLQVADIARTDLKNAGSLASQSLGSTEKLKEEASANDDAFTYQDLSPTEPIDFTIEAKKYNPFKKLFIPRYLQPGIFVGDSVLISLSTGSTDPLLRHSWQGGVTYRTDAAFLGGYFTYSYQRLKPTIFFNFYDFAVNFGNLFGDGQRFFEERKRFSLGSSYSFQAKGNHQVLGYYFFERRSALRDIPEDAEKQPSLGNFSGLGFRYQFDRTKRFPGSISLEGGPRIQLDLQLSDAILGSNSANEQFIFSGDVRHYFALPLDGHVFAIRAMGGAAFGDRLLQGTFRLGSALGEGFLTSPSPRLFPLRGLPQVTFAGERAVLLSGEYRLPLIKPQRGLGTTPIFLKQMHMAFFADYGTVFNKNIDFDKFLLGVGAELRGDFVLGYALPISGRLGYGIIVSGREFIQGLKDPITQADISHGTLILQIGTSF